MRIVYKHKYIKCDQIRYIIKYIFIFQFKLWQVSAILNMIVSKVNIVVFAGTNTRKNMLY